MIDRICLCFQRRKCIWKKRSNSIDKDLLNYARHLLSPRNVLCPHCKALMWIDEKVSGSIGKQIFSTCCARKEKLNCLIQLIYLI